MHSPEDFDVCEADMVELVVPNDLQAARQPEDRIMAELARLEYGEDTMFAIKLALEEALTNAVKHGNRNDRSKRIIVRYHIDARRAVIMVRDEGCGFCPGHVPDPTREENLERPNGRGLMLMHAYMTRVQFNEAGNEVWMLKERNPHAPAGSRPARRPT